MSVQAGERFVFVTASGDRSTYEVECNGDGSPAMAHNAYKLVNVETGKIGWASAKWLREGPTPNAKGYFEAAA